jgi:hypothetical protein
LISAFRTNSEIEEQVIMKASSNAMREAVSLLQETAQSPFMCPAPLDPHAEMADLEQLFLLNIQMRRQNLDRWVRLLTEEVQARNQAVRSRRQARAAAQPPLRASA